MGSTGSPTTGRPATRWGDRAGRRRDILDAARALIARHGYLTLNMRDVATGAGVSPGTLYSYFATKEEIFTTLYAEAIEAHSETLAPLCASATDLDAFLVELATGYVEVYATYGRYFSLWAALAADGVPADGPLPAELTESLRAATLRQGRLLAGALRRMLPGAEDPATTRRRLAFLWSVLGGVAEHLTSERHRLSGVEADELIAFSARTVAAGLRAGGAP